MCYRICSLSHQLHSNAHGNGVGELFNLDILV